MRMQAIKAAVLHVRAIGVCGFLYVPLAKGFGPILRSGGGGGGGVGKGDSSIFSKSPAFRPP